MQVPTTTSSHSSLPSMIVPREEVGLPWELWYEIALYLSFRDLCRLGGVSRALYRLASADHYLWRRRCLLDFGEEQVWRVLTLPPALSSSQRVRPSTKTPRSPRNSNPTLTVSGTASDRSQPIAIHAGSHQPRFRGSSSDSHSSSNTSDSDSDNDGERAPANTNGARPRPQLQAITIQQYIPNTWKKVYARIFLLQEDGQWLLHRTRISGTAEGRGRTNITVDVVATMQEGLMEAFVAEDKGFFYRSPPIREAGFHEYAQLLQAQLTTPTPPPPQSPHTPLTDLDSPSPAFAMYRCVACQGFCLQSPLSSSSLTSSSSLHSSLETTGAPLSHSPVHSSPSPFAFGPFQQVTRSPRRASSPPLSLFRRNVLQQTVTGVGGLSLFCQCDHPVNHPVTVTRSTNVFGRTRSLDGSSLLTMHTSPLSAPVPVSPSNGNSANMSATHASTSTITRRANNQRTWLKRGFSESRQPLPLSLVSFTAASTSPPTVLDLLSPHSLQR